MFSMVISVFSEVISVISVDFGDFGESCYPSNDAIYLYQVSRKYLTGFQSY